VQEAATAGLPLICSDACGATVHLLQDRHNGFLVEVNRIEQLANAMARMTKLDDEKRRTMGRRSHELSKQFTPQRWADTLFDGILSLKSN